MATNLLSEISSELQRAGNQGLRSESRTKWRHYLALSHYAANVLECNTICYITLATVMAAIRPLLIAECNIPSSIALFSGSYN